MYSDKFFQTFRSRYKTEGAPNQISITVEIDGTPHEIDTDGVDAMSQPANKPKIKKTKARLNNLLHPL